LVECPSCGTEVTVALKSWPVTFKKQGEYYVKPKFFIGIFECPKCKSKFRSRVESAVKPAESPRFEELLQKVKSIQTGLIQTKKALHEKISRLETERGSLMLELGDLQKDAEFRAEELESEICQLREEIKSLKELLGSTEKDTE
jgi:transcription elongation factor Elf1